jgi:hypothetical protein
MAAYLLRRNGYKVDTTCNGRLRSPLQGQVFDLILAIYGCPSWMGQGSTKSWHTTNHSPSRV